MRKKIAIITAIYNNYIDIQKFINSLKKQWDQNYHLFITDSSDVKKEINTQGIAISIIYSKNKGYAAAINRGIEKAVREGFEHFCIINDDTFFEKDFVEKARNLLNQHPNSIIGGKIYYAPGHEYHKRRYKKNHLGKVLWYAGGSIDWNHVYVAQRGVDEIDRGQYNVQETTDFVTGCLMLFDKKVLNTNGLWDEGYFLYFEDADFCERAKKKGIRLLFDPTLVIWHKVSQSTGGSGSSLHQRYQARNRVKFGMRYAPLRTKVHLLKNYFLKSLFKT